VYADEGDWDTVGEAAGGSHSLAPTVEELLAQMERVGGIRNQAFHILKIKECL
jgi:hypothetical protein